MKPRTLLIILLILSIITAATSLQGSLLMALFLPWLDQFYSTHPQLLEQFHLTATWEVMSQVPRVYYAVMSLLWALSLTGCILMFRIRWTGFHCYTIAQLLIIAVPPLILGKGHLAIGDIMFAALFIFLYWRLLKTLSQQG